MTHKIHRYLTASPLAFSLACCYLFGLTACGDSAEPTAVESLPAEVGSEQSPSVGATSRTKPVEPPFADVTTSSGLSFVHSPFLTGSYYMPEIMGAGVGLIDYDRDGDLDVYLLQGATLGKAASASTDQLFKNLWVESGELAFENVTQGSGLAASGYGMGVAVGDYDADGYDDLFVTNFGANELWRNLGNGQFEDVSRSAGISDTSWSSSAAFVDVDNDGDLDLYVVNYVAFSANQNFTCTSESGQRDYCGPDTYKPVPDSLYVNNGEGRFVQSSARFGLDKAYGPGLGVAVSDFDGNGYADIYVANDGAPNQLWMNTGRGQFEDNGLMSGTSLNADGVAEAGMGVTAGDFDKDGDDDLFMTHLTAETNTLYMNNGKGQFYDATNQVNLAADSLAMTGFGAGWLDYDNDTYLDLFVANGNVKLEPARAGKSDYPFEQRNQLFRNVHADSGRYEFVEVSEQAPKIFNVLEVSRGAAFGDLNNDGSVDIVLTNNNGPARVFENVVPAGEWYGIRLRQPDHQSVEGAVVSLEAGPVTLDTRTLRRTGSYLSSHGDRVRLINLDKSGANEMGVVVTWPDGVKERWHALASGRYHTLQRGQGKVRQPTGGSDD